MKRTTRAILFGSAALAVTTIACQPAGQEAGQEASVDTAAIRAELDSVRTAFEEDFAAGDMDAMAAAYAEDAVFSAPGQPPVRGRDSIRAVMARTHPEGATIEIQPMDVIVLDGDRVFEYGTSVVRFTPEGAQEAVEAPATYAVFMKRTPDGWRLHREALSSDAPPPGSGGQ